jgi:RNA 2',3'-cyclic 3'-phosphodiesterase
MAGWRLLRAFVALELPGPAIDSLVLFQGELSSTGADLKLVERENLHFTVKFLGEITESQVADCKARLGSLSLQGAQVEVRGVGAFPTSNKPRVVWAGVLQEHEALVAPIAETVIASLEGIGERDERPFRAHVTLARVRSARDLRRLGDFLRENSDRSFGTVRLRELKLKSSQLTPRGPIYTDLGAYPLS